MDFILTDVTMFLDLIFHVGYLVTAGIAMVGGVLYVAMKPDRLKIFTEGEGFYYLVSLIALLLIMIWFMILQLLLDFDAAMVLFSLIQQVGMTMIMALCALPLTNFVLGSNDSQPEELLASTSSTVYGVTAASILTVVWTLSFLGVVTFLEVREVISFFEGEILKFITFEYPGVLLGFMTMAMAAAIYEELIFRGGIQGFLQGIFGTRGLALVPVILIPSFIWAVGHGFVIDPWGFKQLHIFVLGIIFGLTRLFYGLKWAVFLHLLNNGMALFLEFIL